MPNFHYIDIERLKRDQLKIRQEYHSAKPFQMVIVDNFLTLDGLRDLDTHSLSNRESTQDRSSDLIFAKAKIENPNIADISVQLSALKAELLSVEFQEFLNFITEKNLFIDPDFTGGGLHQGGKGSFLEMHADFSRHPTHRDWIRELNILLYLNKDWQPQFGGCLDLVNARTGERTSIEPLENRLVIMLTKEHTIHGYKKINFPEGSFRTSIAGYAYWLDDGSEEVPYRSTTWMPSSAFGKAVAHVINTLVPLKQKYFGSRTAKRSRK